MRADLRNDLRFLFVASKLSSFCKYRSRSRRVRDECDRARAVFDVMGRKREARAKRGEKGRKEERRRKEREKKRRRKRRGMRFASNLESSRRKTVINRGKEIYQLPALGPASVCGTIPGWKGITTAKG